MGSRKKVSEERRTAAVDREQQRVWKACQVQGTIYLENDYATTHLREMVGGLRVKGKKPRPSTVTKYVKILEAQLFVQVDSATGLHVTMASSGSNYLTNMLPAEQAQHRASIDWAAFGGEGGRGNRKAT